MEPLVPAALYALVGLGTKPLFKSKAAVLAWFLFPLHGILFSFIDAAAADGRWIAGVCTVLFGIVVCVFSGSDWLCPAVAFGVILLGLIASGKDETKGKYP